MFDKRHKDKKRSGKHRGRHSSAKSGIDTTLRNIDQFVVEEIELSDTTSPQWTATVKTRKPSRLLPAVRLVATVIALVLLPVIASLVTRPAWPGDESRFLAMAWEMWVRGEWLVPRLNGAPVAMAPMFFWVIHAGWSAFGVVEWWPRLVPALFMLGSLFLAARLAVFVFWPGSTALTRRLPLALLGGFFWVASATLLTPDFLTVFFTLFALLTLAWMWRTRDLRVWLLLALALGLGLLASGALILLYVLPVALLAPLWARGTVTMPWNYWYIDIAKATLVGLVIFGCWLVPAAGRAGGAALLLPVLTAPLSTHALELYQGAYPWWWVLALLPVLGFPWSLWPLPWMRLLHIRREPTHNGVLFCMLWALPVIALLAWLPVRQPQLLLPLVPAFFLVFGWLVLDEKHEGHDHSRVASSMVFPLLLLGGLLAVLPGLPRIPELPQFLWEMSPFVGVAIIVIGVALGWLPMPELETRVSNMAVAVAVLATLGLLAFGWQYGPRYDTSAAAALIAKAEQQGRPVAHVGAYAGQFHFNGRLTRPLEVITPEQTGAWLIEHPDGLLVSYANVWQPAGAADSRPLYEQPFGDSQLKIWQASEVKIGFTPAPIVAGPQL